MFPFLMFLLFFAHIEVLRYIGPDIPNVSFHDGKSIATYLIENISSSCGYFCCEFSSSSLCRMFWHKLHIVTTLASLS